jgi:predicted lactoylglutathione lyase
MIGYVTLGTNDLERGAKFYDAIAAELGTGRMMEWPGAIAWGSPGGAGAGLGLTKPYDGQAATIGNGVMVALEAKSKEQVHKLHAIALANGGTCEGPPGPRGDAFYAAYFRDPDGNKLNAFLMTGAIEDTAAGPGSHEPAEAGA